MRRTSILRVLWLGIILSACMPTPVWAQAGFHPAAECFDDVPENVDDSVEPETPDNTDDPPGQSSDRNPGPRDTDGDGIPDPWDVCVHHIDPEQEDDDGDGVGNACEGRGFWAGHWIIDPAENGHPGSWNESDDPHHRLASLDASGCDVVAESQRCWLWIWVCILGAATRRRRRAPGEMSRYSAVSAVRMSKSDSGWLDPSA